jgi:hypothetical protein
MNFLSKTFRLVKLLLSSGFSKRVAKVSAGFFFVQTVSNVFFQKHHFFCRHPKKAQQQGCFYPFTTLSLNANRREK